MVHTSGAVYSTIWESVAQSTMKKYCTMRQVWYQWLAASQFHRVWDDKLLVQGLQEYREAGAHKWQLKLLKLFVQKESTALGYDVGGTAFLAAYWKGLVRSFEGKSGWKKPRRPISGRKLHALTHGNIAVDVRCLLWLGYYLMLRSSEAMQLRKSDFQWQTSTHCRVLLRRPKNHGQRVLLSQLGSGGKGLGDSVPLEVLGTIYQWMLKRKGGLLFHQTDKHSAAKWIQTNCVSSQWYFSYHSLRHGRVTDLYEQLEGSHKEKMQMIADGGHWKTTTALSYYLHHGWAQVST